MKLLTLIFCAFSISASAGDLGKKIELKVDKGVPQMYFATNGTADATRAVYLAFYVNPLDLAKEGRIENLSYRFYDMAAQKYISEWVLYFENTPAYFQGNFSLQLQFPLQDIARQVYLSLQNLVVVVSVNAADDTHPVATGYLAIGNICATNPALFVNITTKQVGCNPVPENPPVQVSPPAPPVTSP